MDGNFWLTLGKIIVFIPFIVLLIYLSLKYGGSKLQSMQSGRYIKIYERVTLSKENSIIIAKIGDKGYVLASSQGKIEILNEVSEADLIKIQISQQVPEFANLKELYKKMKTKKED
jgi:flagellar protein FliO/FliZ